MPATCCYHPSKNSVVNDLLHTMVQQFRQCKCNPEEVREPICSIGNRPPVVRPLSEYLTQRSRVDLRVSWFHGGLNSKDRLRRLFASFILTSPR